MENSGLLIRKFLSQNGPDQSQNGHNAPYKEFTMSNILALPSQYSGKARDLAPSLKMCWTAFTMLKLATMMPASALIPSQAA